MCRYLPIYRFLGKSAMRTSWMAGTAPHKSRRCRDKSQSDNHTQLSWDCYICYPDLPYTQIIQTYNSHRHNTTNPQPLPIYITHTTTTQTHVQHSTCPHRIGKGQTQSSYPLTAPQTYHHPVYRFKSWPTQMTSSSYLHTQVRVQPRNTYNHIYIKFLSGQNNLTQIQTKQSHTNPDKTTCTLFTPDPAEYTSNLDLTINNKALPMATHPKVLGLTLDPKLTYSTHIHNISVQAHKPLQIIKALTATGWGK